MHAPNRHHPRRGSMHVLLVVLFIIFLLVLGWVMNSGFLLAVLAEVERNGDASALSASLELVDDGHLKGFLNDDPQFMSALLDAAHNTAKNIAQLNPVNGKQLILQDNLNNDAGGDIILGTKATPAAAFVRATNVNDAMNKSLIGINAVQLNLRLLQNRGTELKMFFPNITTFTHQEIQFQVTTMLDRDVIGFKHGVEAAIPIAPLALKADFLLIDIDSWSKQIEEKDVLFLFRKDEYRFNGTTFVLGKDDIPEFLGKIPLPLSGVAANVAPLFLRDGDKNGALDDNDFDSLNQQILDGFTKDDLTAFQNTVGSDFELQPANNRIPVPGTSVGPPLLSQQQLDLVTNLNTLRANGAIRVWPLYCGFAGGDPILCGFVAGRVVTVELLGAVVLFRVQPTQIAINSAVTNFNQDGNGGVDITNKYIFKARVVEN